MGEGNGMMNPGIMALNADHATVPHGVVTFRVTNAGVVDHEMVILPLAASQVVGTRPFGGDAKIEKTHSLGEASKSGGEGPGGGNRAWCLKPDNGDFGAWTVRARVQHTGPLRLRNVQEAHRHLRPAPNG
jgi:hypothetical protein